MTCGGGENAGAACLGGGVADPGGLSSTGRLAGVAGSSPYLGAATPLLTLIDALEAILTLNTITIKIYH